MAALKLPGFYWLRVPPLKAGVATMTSDFGSIRCKVDLKAARFKIDLAESWEFDFQD